MVVGAGDDLLANGGGVFPDGTVIVVGIPETNVR
jgi:hypothetical protein